MRRITAIIFVLLFILSCSVYSVSASENYATIETQQIAENTISKFGDYLATGSVPLYNTSLQLEAICYTFSPTGYVIVNLNDYSVPEFSPTNISPFLAVDALDLVVYNGPLSYYTVVNEDTFRSLNGESLIHYDELGFHYHVEYDSEAQSLAISHFKLKGSTYSIFTRSNPVKWSSSYACGVDGCAIILKYLDTYHDSNLLDSNISSNISLQEYLVENKYLNNDNMFTWTIPSGYLTLYTGINDFFSDRGTSFSSSSKTYTNSIISDITRSIAYNYPLLLETWPSTLWSYGYHYIILYGYYTDGIEDYFVINDGFGNDGVYLTTEQAHYGDIVFFNN